MRINLRDLSPEILYKLNQLDDVKELCKRNPGCAITYTEDGFSLIKIPEIKEPTSEKTIDDVRIKSPFSERRITNLEEALFHPTKTDKSSLYTDMSIGTDPFHVSAASFTRNVEMSSILTCRDKIMKTKFYSNEIIFILDRRGFLTRLNNMKVDRVIYVTELINKNFNRDITPREITDLTIIDQNNVLISTVNGVNAISLMEEQPRIEFVISENNITHLEVFGRDILIATKNDSLVVYKLPSYKILKKIYTIKNNHEIPFKTKVVGNRVFILLKSLLRENLINPLYCLKLDKSGLNVEEEIIPLNHKSTNYDFDYFDCDGKEIHLFNVMNKKISVLSYDLEDIKGAPRETIIDFKDFENITEIRSSSSKENTFLIISDNILTQVSEGKVVCSLNVGELRDTRFINSELYGTVRDEFVRIDIPTYTKNDTKTKFLIDGKKCNNMEILIKNASTSNVQLMTLEGQFIEPSKSVLYEGNRVMRLNPKGKDFIMEISFKEDEKVLGFVIRKNSII